MTKDQLACILSVPQSSSFLLSTSLSCQLDSRGKDCRQILMLNIGTGVRDGSLQDEDCTLFLAIATRRPPLSVPRFAALVNDFASIARSENTSDVLLAYDL